MWFKGAKPRTSLPAGVPRMQNDEMPLRSQNPALKVQRRLGSLDRENRNFQTGGGEEKQARNTERICQIFTGKGWFGIRLKDWRSGRLKQYLIQLLLAATETDTSPVQSASRQLTAVLDAEQRARGASAEDAAVLHSCWF